MTSFDTDPRRPPPLTPSRVVLNALERFAAEPLVTRFGFFVTVAVVVVVVAGVREEVRAVDARRSRDSGFENLAFLLGMVAATSSGAIGSPLLLKAGRPSTPVLRAARAARI